MSRTSNDRCGICGRFMSYPDMREAVITAQSVYLLSMEPPEDVYNHKACFEKQCEQSEYWQAEAEAERGAVPV